MVAQVTTEKPFDAPDTADLIGERTQHLELHDIGSAERQLLSTQDYNDALMRLRHLDIPIQAFLNVWEKLAPFFIPRFEEVVENGLSFSIREELFRRDEDCPHRVDPRAFPNLTINSADVQHSMQNHWQLLMMVDSSAVPKPEVGDWSTHIAQFVFLAVDEAYFEQGGPPLLSED